MPLKRAIAEAINNRNLPYSAAEEAMNVIMSGTATPAQIGSYLTALRMKGETAEEIAGSAAAMRAHVIGVKRPNGQMVIDTVGTGGDGHNTFNITTTTAFVVAGAGLKVAKHGNRSASSKCGAADVLMALGGNLDLEPQQITECIDEIGFGFLYAVRHHPAMRHAIGPRRELGQRTVFNILGPLTNPAGVTRLLIGVYAPELTELMAHALKHLGTEAAYVVHGADGLDELSTTGVNRVTELRDGEIRTYELDPADLGFARTSLESLVGGEPDENREIMRKVVDGTDTGPRRDIVLLNAAAALAFKTGDLQSGVEAAKESIDSGAAIRTLDSWIQKTNSF